MSILLESYERDFEKNMQLSNRMINTFHITEDGWWVLLFFYEPCLYLLDKKEQSLNQIKKYMTEADNNVF